MLDFNVDLTIALAASAAACNELLPQSMRIILPRMG